MACQKQESTDSGWDNPFRPGGDLSREADEIINMIKGGKPITPTETVYFGNGIEQTDYNKLPTENPTKTNIPQTGRNGDTSLNLQPITGISERNGISTETYIANKVIPGPTSASHVVIGDNNNKKRGCCVIQ